MIGESDGHAEHPVTDPVPPADVGTTILEFAGIGSQERAELKVLPGGHVISGLL